MSGQFSGMGRRAASQHASGGDSPWQHSSGGSLSVQHSAGSVSVSFPPLVPAAKAAAAWAAVGINAAPVAAPASRGAFPLGSLLRILVKAWRPWCATAVSIRFLIRDAEISGSPTLAAFQFTGPTSLWEIRDIEPQSPGSGPAVRAVRLEPHRWYVVPDRAAGQAWVPRWPRASASR